MSHPAKSFVHWECLRGRKHDRQQLSEKLGHLAREVSFGQSPATKWAYLKVATFLEDGWESQQQYTTIDEQVCSFTLDELGQMVNTLVCGSRYDEAKAKELQVPWLGRGSYPTELDRVALLFFMSCEPPS